MYSPTFLVSHPGSCANEDYGKLFDATSFDVVSSDRLSDQLHTDGCLLRINTLQWSHWFLYTLSNTTKLWVILKNNIFMTNLLVFITWRNLSDKIDSGTYIQLAEWRWVDRNLLFQTRDWMNKEIRVLWRYAEIWCSRWFSLEWEVSVKRGFRAEGANVAWKSKMCTI